MFISELRKIYSIIDRRNASNNYTHIELNLINFSILKPISPETMLLVCLIISSFDSLIGSFYQCWSIQMAINWNKLGKISFLYWILLNDSLLSMFLAKFKSSNMEYFQFHIYKYSESVRLKTLWITWNMHSPVLIPFKLTSCYVKLFCKLSLWYKNVSRKQFLQKFKRLIFLSIILD